MGKARVDRRAFSAWRESRRVCWTTMGTSEESRSPVLRKQAVSWLVMEGAGPVLLEGM
jgi:hypothetical protein